MTNMKKNDNKVSKKTASDFVKIANEAAKKGGMKLVRVKIK